MFPFSLFENKKEGLPAESIVVLPANVTNLKKKKERKKKKIYSYNNARLQGLSRKTVFKKQQRAKLLENTFHC